MAIIQLTFPGGLPNNLQEGSTAWYLKTENNSTINMGLVESIDNSTNTVSIDLIPGTTPPGVDDFVFYEQPALVNVGSIKGYYAEIQFRNDSTTKAELFSIGSEVFESSK